MQCSDLSSCFQAIYNILFVILIALAFLYFLYGAFLYLLSGAGIYNKQEGKNKMQNAIYSILIALIIPVILNTINPDIFQVQLKIPQVKVQMPFYYVDLRAVAQSEKDLNDDDPSVKNSGRLQAPNTSVPLKGPKYKCLVDGKRTCDVNVVFEEALRNGQISRLNFANDDKGTEYINPAIKDYVLDLIKQAKSEGIHVTITDGFSQGDHASKCHTQYGTCIDVVVAGKPPNDRSWDRVIQIAQGIGFSVLDERYIKGSQYSKGAHLHLKIGD
jgi:hypothetical protein